MGWSTHLVKGTGVLTQDSVGSYTCANMGCFQQVSYAQQSSAMKGKTESACYGPNAHYSYCTKCDSGTCDCQSAGFYYGLRDAMTGMLVRPAATYHYNMQHDGHAGAPSLTRVSE